MLDIEQPGALAAYLRHTGRVAAGEALDVELLSGGVSNRTMLVRRGSGGDWVVKQALPKLRVEVDWFCDPARIRREAAGLHWLFQLAPPGTITRLLFEDRQHGLLAMEAVPAPHENWKTALLAGRVEPERVRQFARLLGAIHGRAYARRDEVAGHFRQRQFFEALRLEPYYQYTAGQVPEAAAFLQALVTQTRATAQTLVHGDYSPKNILLHGPRMVLLDHEVVHWGDPAFDLGFSLTHLLSKAHHLPGQRTALAAAAGLYWDEYQAALGDVPWRSDLEARAVRHTLACLLARVAGRSPLEYLDQAERAAQRAAVVRLLVSPPETIEALASAFLKGLTSLSLPCAK